MIPVGEAYFTLQLPYVPWPHRTVWHPNMETGPFSVLTRGTFATYTEALEWARDKLNGTPYSIVFVPQVGTIAMDAEVCP